MPSSPKEQRIVTMRDVAEAAGVSRMTVSRALRKDSPVSEKTRAEILRVVREMNYVPDQMAGSLSTKRSGFAAVLVPSLNNLHFAQTVQALTDELEKTGLQILLGHTDYSAAREEELVELMLRRRPETLLLSFDGHSDRTIALLSDAHIPIVELWETPKNPLGHTVGFSNEAAAAELTQALIAKGYRNIAFLGEADDDWTRGAARHAGFLRAMKEAGLSGHREIRLGTPPLSIEDGAMAGLRLLEMFPDTDCIFCVSDVPAFGVLSSFRQRGIDVPGQIGIAGFGNFELSRFASPTITTVEVDPIGIGRAAGALVEEALGGEIAPRQISIPAKPSFRGTTRA